MALLRSYSFNEPEKMIKPDNIFKDKLNQEYDKLSKKKLDNSDYKGPSFDQLFQKELSKED